MPGCGPLAAKILRLCEQAHIDTLFMSTPAISGGVKRASSLPDATSKVKKSSKSSQSCLPSGEKPQDGRNGNRKWFVLRPFQLAHQGPALCIPQPDVYVVPGREDGPIGRESSRPGHSMVQRRHAELQHRARRQRLLHLAHISAAEFPLLGWHFGGAFVRFLVYLRAGSVFLVLGDLSPGPVSSSGSPIGKRCSHRGRHAAQQNDSHYDASVLLWSGKQHGFGHSLCKSRDLGRDKLGGNSRCRYANAADFHGSKSQPHS